MATQLDANQAIQTGFDDASQSHQVTETNLSNSFDAANNAIQTVQLAQLVPQTYDSIELTYVTAGNGLGEIETVTYKQGGTGGTQVALLTLSYDASNNLISVVRT